MKVIVALFCLIAVVMAQTEPEPPVDCDVSSDENDWAVLVPNPEDCGSYYACNGGLPILMVCPEGLHFNPKLSVCDYPEVVECKPSKLS